MNVTVDVGNTFSKVGVFSGSVLVALKVLKTETLKQELELYSGYPLVISTVGKPVENLSLNPSAFSPFISLTAETPLPVLINYSTPQTLGSDRIAAVCGAVTLAPGVPCLVLDTGTCLTYEWITADGSYEGGAIAPGLQMRLSAMNTFTSRLPLIKVSELPDNLADISLIGKDTYSCLLSGAVNGMLEEIRSIIRMYTHKFQNLQVFICGGDALKIGKALKETGTPGKVIIEEQLVLIGLNRILSFNVK